MNDKRPGPPSPRTSRASEFFDSRDVSPGIGFPSLCRELAVAPRNTRDPHDYYRELGVDPGATREEIKSRLRRLYVELHPDTGVAPDPDRLNRVKNIAEVLLDDQQRLKYDNTPEGRRLMDRVYVEELKDKVGVLKVMSEEGVKEALQAAPANPYGKVGRFDYFSIGHRSTDPLVAQQWYHYLMASAVRPKHRGRLRLLLWDGERPAWNAGQEILMVPRRWDPSSHAAHALMVRVIGTTSASNLSGDSSRTFAHSPQS